jgi:RimJ/RimL family protein N-acetyltransferase
MNEVTADATSMVLHTERLRLRRLTLADADFMLELLNDPAFHEHIGDRGVRTYDEAARYIEKGAMASYDQFGFGFYCVELIESGQRIGICGLAKREVLEDADIGFAYLPDFRQSGYGYEAAEAVMRYAQTQLGMDRVVAIVSVANHASARLLEKIGLRFERMVRLAEDQPDIRLFAWQAS